MCKHQFIRIFIPVDPTVNMLPRTCQVVFVLVFLTWGSPQAENERSPLGFKRTWLKKLDGRMGQFVRFIENNFTIYYFRYLVPKQHQFKTWQTAAARSQSLVHRRWCDEVKVVNSEIMWYQRCHRLLSHVSLLFPRSLHLPLQTDVPPRDRQPLFVQAQACPYVCVCVSARRPLHAYLGLLRNVQEITGKTELNIM